MGTKDTHLNALLGQVAQQGGELQCMRMALAAVLVLLNDDQRLTVAGVVDRQGDRLKAGTGRDAFGPAMLRGYEHSRSVLFPAAPLGAEGGD
jgi:hypothetical protein